MKGIKNKKTPPAPAPTKRFLQKKSDKMTMKSEIM